ncbi:MAG: SLC13 family permease [Planctomycetes bacterium]|nr:SLC13 family permease [Planctomycetota bacterium]MBL7008472.1 SLC13 family permease [Planctomycetota bacterium]
MGPDAILVVALTFLVLILLVLEKASLDAIGLGLMVALVATGVLDVSEALRGFSNYAVITIAALYIIGEGLNRTGAIEFLARMVLRYSGGGERGMVLMVGLIAAAVSSVLNNTAVVVVFIPVLLGLARQTGVAGSRLMIPLSFASILGGMCTLVGTSTNLLVSGAAENLGQAPLEMFEMTPLGVPLALVGILFMAFFGKKLLPKRHSLSAMVGGAGTREYVTELVIGHTSPLVGQTFAAAFKAAGVEMLFFVRGEQMHWPPYFEERIEEGDVVMLRGKVDELANLQTSLGLKMVNGISFDPKTMEFFEVAVAPHSTEIGTRLGDLHLWRDFGAVIVAVLRDGHHIRERASQLELRPGDLLLVCGEEVAQVKFGASSDYFLLRGAQEHVVLRDRGRRALAVAGGVVGLFILHSVFHVEAFPLPMAATLGAIAMVATGCLPARRVYRAIDWPILLFVVGTLALGSAMGKTGAADFFASGLVGWLEDMGPAAVISGLVMLCIIFNAVISHSAVAVLLTPIAVKAAEQMIADPDFTGDPAKLMRAFLLAIAFGGSICFATPIGHQTNLMVYGPGGYRYSDYLRLGLPLSLIAWIMVSLGVPWLTGL